MQDELIKDVENLFDHILEEELKNIDLTDMPESINEE